MERAAKLKLKVFLEKNIPFYELKEAGVFNKDIHKNHYEKIAARICHIFGYKSIYEYKPVCRGIKCKGGCSGTTPHCKSYTILHDDRPLKIDYLDLISNDIWLN